MADRCSFCGSAAGPFSKVEGLVTVLMCADWQAARGHGRDHGRRHQTFTRTALSANTRMEVSEAFAQLGGLRIRLSPSKIVINTLNPLSSDLSSFGHKDRELGPSW
jgi:hypothetical protein